MKNLIISSTLFISAFSFSQITVTESDFPTAGDTAMITSSLDLTIDFASTGADYNWDFSDLSINAQEIDTFHDVSGGSVLVQAAFNNWLTAPNYESEYYNEFEGLSFGSIPGLSLGNTNEFTRYTGSEIQIVGWAIDINDVEVPIQADDIDNKYEVPLNYSDNWTSTFFIDLDLNPAFDGIYRRYQDRTSTVDGWGTVSTPFGSFDCIRIKSDLSYDDSIYVGTFSTWTAIPTPDRHEYTWWTNGQKIPVLKLITTGSGTEVVTSIEFKDKDRNLANVEENSPDALTIYPNPASEQITLGIPTNANEVVIRNAAGSVVRRLYDVSESTQVSLEGWNSGMYFVEVLSDEYRMRQRFIVR